MMPGEIVTAPGELELNKGRNPITHRGRQHRRPADPGRQPLSFLRDQRCARASTASAPRACGSTSPPAPPCASSPASRAPCGSRPTWVAARATASRPGSRASWGRSSRSVRPTRARPASRARPMPTCSAPRWATRCGWPTPTSSSRSRRTHTTYGEEVKFGGGKVIRDGMGQSQRTRAQGAVDTVITNALIVDHWGIVKADIGLKDGRIVGIGKAGNPDIQPRVDIVIGPGTEVDRRRRQDRHRGRHRLPHPFHRPAADRGGALQRRHHHDGRRHRPGARHLRHHHARPARGISAACCRRPRLPDESRLLRQGQHQQAGRHRSRSRPAPAA